MSEQLPLFRAARLAGVTRSTLQKRIHDEGVETFEGSISLPDLVKLYPKTDLGHDSEYERVQSIKVHAYSKRVRERIMPDPEVLISRVNEFARELGEMHTRVEQYQSIIQQITDRLRSIEHNAEQSENASTPGVNTGEAIRTLINQINTTLSDFSSEQESESEILAHDTVLRIMAAHIKIQPSNHEYWLEGNSSLLEAGVRSGLSLNYGCTNGNCGLCKARLVDGEVKKIRNHDYVLSEAEKSMDYFLMCSNTAVSDVVIEALEAKDSNDIPRQEIVTRVKKLDQLNNNILELHLQTPRVKRLRFLAGQSVTLTLPDGDEIELPIASCPCDDRNLLFHVHAQMADTTGQAISDALSKGSDVKVIGPHGDFLFREGSNNDQIYIAFDTGFAPIKSLIEHAMALDETASMHLYRVANNKDDLYLNNLCRAWDDALEDFHYHPIIGNDLLKEITKQHQQLNEFDFYIAGEKQQTETIQKGLADYGIPSNQIAINASN